MIGSMNFVPCDKRKGSISSGLIDRMEVFKPILRVSFRFGSTGGIYAIVETLSGFFGGIFWMRGFLDEGIWVGRRRRRRRRREGLDEERGGEGEGDETMFFVCGDEKREKGKLPKERVGRIQKCDQGGFVV